jgi:hypothetical protein
LIHGAGWIWTGDDPTEVAKPLPPPPMGPKHGTEKASNTSSLEQETRNDPLAALMAPPSRAPSAIKRSGFGGSADKRTPGQYVPGMMPPGPKGLLSPAPGPTPQFAVFTPTSAVDGGKDSTSVANAGD